MDLSRSGHKLFPKTARLPSSAITIKSRCLPTFCLPFRSIPNSRSQRDLAWEAWYPQPKQLHSKGSLLRAPTESVPLFPLRTPASSGSISLFRKICRRAFTISTPELGRRILQEATFSNSSRITTEPPPKACKATSFIGFSFFFQKPALFPEVPALPHSLPAIPLHQTQGMG